MTPEELRERAEEILARDEFSEPEPSYFERALEWLFDLLGRIIGEVLGALGLGGVGGGLAWLILAVVVVALIVVLVRAITRWEPSLGREGASTSVSSTRRRSAAQWRAMAAEHEAAGRFDEAVRCHHRAAVVEVAERLDRDDEPGSTAGSWRRRADESGVADLDELTELFDDVWYGAEPANADDVRRAAASPFDSAAPGESGR